MSFMNKEILKNFAILHSQESCRPAILLKADPNTGCFPLNIAKFNLVHHEVYLLTVAAGFLK